LWRRFTFASLLACFSACVAETKSPEGARLESIYMSTDARDTDLWLEVLAVAPDGTAWNLMSPGLDVSRNLHTGELETVSSRTQKARITIHHDGNYPSRLILPVMRSENGGRP
jgi:predicted acyl esterase